MRIGFMSANFIARASGYDGDRNWQRHSKLTRESSDLEDMKTWLHEVSQMGFEGIAMHVIHCWYHGNASDRARKIRKLVASYNLPIYSYAGEFNISEELEVLEKFDQLAVANWERTFTVAKELGSGWLSGTFGLRENGTAIREMCNRFELKFCFENSRNEKSVDDILRKIDGFEDFMDVTLDTGWAGTCGFDAPESIWKLKERIKEVHLKDVKEPGQHNTCALGRGIVGIESCLEALGEIGFDGWITIEHEPFDRNPMPEIQTSFELVKSWMERMK